MKYTFQLLLLLISTCVSAQISYGDYPFTLNAETFQQTKTLNLSTPNIDSLKNEDEITDNYKDIPWRFGAVIFKRIDFFQTAERNVLLDGTIQYRLKLSSKGAVSINLNYSEFDLKKGAQIFIHNSDFTETIGAFTHQNNPNKTTFATTLTSGNTATIEAIVPAEIDGESKVVISSIVHGYRSLSNKAASFGSSGNCNIDVNCSEGIKWQNEKRSVVLILRSNNSRYCSGALINNVRQDTTPYVLTANHCGLDAGSSIFIFNYESAACSPRTDGPTNQSIVGSTFRASNFKSDFTLLELFNSPPAAYNVYYSGWDASGVTPKSGTGIHHPRGDVKKISHDFDSLKSDQYNGATLPDGHWEVSDWDSGTTEPVSSGSPLYNERHRIVGQLHGGQANCGNDRPDFYGKFSNSWDYDTPANQQLKKWLDPDTTNILILDGLDPNPALFTRDLEVLGFDGPYFIQCGTQLSAPALVANRGNAVITSYELSYRVNNGPAVSVSFNDTIQKNEVVEAQLPPILFNKGANNLMVYVSQVNGSSDQFALNDSLITNINAFIPSKTVKLTFKTDDYGSELSYQILDSIGNTVFYNDGSFDNVTGGQTFNYDYCLTDGCYTLKIDDLANDGYCCSFGNGFTLITYNNDTLLFDNAFNTGSQSFSFCIADTSTHILEQTLADKIKVYPNPSNGEIFISFENTIQLLNYEVYDLNGRLLIKNEMKRTEINISELNRGVYLLRIETDKGPIIKKIVKR